MSTGTNTFLCITSAGTEEKELDRIEKSVTKLRTKLQTEEMYILKFLRNQFLLVLSYYLQQTKKMGKFKKLSEKSVKVENIIREVKRKLENHTTQEKIHSNNALNFQEISVKKQFWLDVREKVHSNKIDKEESIKLLNAALNDLPVINESQWPFDDEEILAVARILLKLFLNSPFEKTAGDFKKNSDQMEQVINEFPNLNIQGNHLPNSGKLKNEYIKHVSDLEDIQSTSKKKPGQTKTKIITGDPSIHLDAISYKLGTCRTDLENLHIPVENNFIKILVEKIEDIQQQLRIIPNKDNLIQKRKTHLISEANSILNSVKAVKSMNEILNTKEKRISEIVGSHASFAKKNVELERLKQEIKEINEPNKATIARKNEVMDKISGFIIAEAAIYSRQKLKAIEDYENYAQQFAFPKRIPTYEVKANEIREMKCYVKCIPEDNEFLQERRKLIENRIDELLKILEKKADENDDIILKLQKIDTIQNEIANSSQKRDETFHVRIFNKYREEIQAVEGFGFRLIVKKMESLQFLHNLEKKFYAEYFKEFFPIIEPLIKKYETLTQQFHNLNFNYNFQEEKQILSTQLQEIQTTIRSKSAPENDQILMEVFTKFFKQSLEILKKMEHLNELINHVKRLKNKLNDPSQNSDTDSEKTLVVKELEDKIDSFEATTSRDGLLKILPNIKKAMLIEKSKIKLNNIVNDNVKCLKEKVISNEISLSKKITELFIVKEKIEDVSGEIEELDSQKKAALEEIKNMLCMLDQSLANFTFKETLYENVLNVENYFTDFQFHDVLCKETVEYVKQIFSHAKTFEYSIKCYLGTKDSVDYYIIHENLMRLLEELDQLECEDDNLLQETVKTMDYIKKLKKELLANASSAD